MMEPLEIEETIRLLNSVPAPLVTLGSPPMKDTIMTPPKLVTELSENMFNTGYFTVRGLQKFLRNKVKLPAGAGGVSTKTSRSARIWCNDNCNGLWVMVDDGDAIMFENLTDRTLFITGFAG